MRNRAPHPRSSVCRNGLSVVEVLVALMLITIGLLGIAGSSAFVLRSAFDAARERDAVRVASNRIALLASRGCTGAAGGSATDSTRRLSEWWTVAPNRNGFAAVRDSVEWMTARGVKRLAVESALSC